MGYSYNNAYLTKKPLHDHDNNINSIIRYNIQQYLQLTTQTHNMNIRNLHWYKHRKQGGRW